MAGLVAIAEEGGKTATGARPLQWIAALVSYFWPASLLERSEPATAFTLQSVVLEFVTDRLVEQVALEIERGQPALLERHALIQGQAKDYMRLSQKRLNRPSARVAARS